ncbi:hypothetical protein F5888DRAFT_257094 [Russula emetica]|nr:hypothetical protein F5888DRAFT_257094 [Russula emetica]
MPRHKQDYSRLSTVFPQAASLMKTKPLFTMVIWRSRPAALYSRFNPALIVRGLALIVSSLTVGWGIDRVIRQRTGTHSARSGCTFTAPPGQHHSSLSSIAFHSEPVNQKGQRTKAKLDTELASRLCSVAGKLRVVSGKTEVAIVTADATNRCGPNPGRSAPPTVLLVVFCQQHLIVLRYRCPEVDRTMSMESSWYCWNTLHHPSFARCVLQLRVIPTHPTPASSFIPSAHRVTQK